MKKMLALLLSLTVLITPLALADGADNSALDAFYSLIGLQTEKPATRTAADYLTDVMNGTYTALPVDDTALILMASDLNALSDISNKDIAAYASANTLNVKQVRNAYYRALGNVLRAEIRVNPALEKDDQNVQTILNLFLNPQNAAEDEARAQIRQELTADAANAIADEYDLPAAFVSFLILDEAWDDDRWDNDDDWRASTTWTEAADADALAMGSRDTATSTRVAELQERLIALGYLTGKADGIFGQRTQNALIQYQRANGLPATGAFAASDEILLNDAAVVARWHYNDSFDDTPDFTPDNTPNDTPRYVNTPDNTPDYHNTPDNTPDRTPDNTP